MCVCVCVCVQTHIYRYVLGCAQSLHACMQLFVTPWTVAHQALLPMVFSRQEYWSGLPCVPAGDLPGLGFELIHPVSPALLAFFAPEPLGQPIHTHTCVCMLSHLVVSDSL